AQDGTPGYTYLWNTVPPQATSTATNLSEGTYQVTVTDNSCVPSGPELVVNGDFSQGNTGFSSGNTYCNTPACISPGFYSVGTNSNVYHPAFWVVGDHTSGSGNFMIVDGGSVPVNVWCQTINVTPNTDYNFSSWVATLYPDNPAELQFTINGVPIGNQYVAPTAVGQWEQFYSSWNSGGATTATICIANLSTVVMGNDFGIDDISFRACSKTCSQTASFTITGPPALTLNITASPSSVCMGENSLLQSNVSGGIPPFSFSWSNGNINGSQTVSPTTTTIYTLDVTDANNCVISENVTVTVNPLPLVNLGPDVAICAGNTAILDAGAGFVSYLWNTGATTQTITVSTVGPYWVTVTDANGCGNNDTLIVTANPLPMVNLGPDVAICAGDNTVLDAGAGFVSYLWSTGATTQTISISSAGTYSVTVTDANGCENNDALIVSVNPLPIVNLGPDVAICAGNSTVLDAGAGLVSYSWSTGAATQTITVSTAGTYSVTVTDANGCENNDALIVSVNPLPVVNLGPDVAICAGNTAVLDAGAGFVSNSWNTGATTQTISVLAAGTYSATVIDINGCQGSDNINITVNTLPLVNVGPDQSICQGNQLTLDAGTGFNGYNWNTGASTQTLNVSTAGTYSVIVTDSNGCQNTDQLEVTVNANPTVNLGNDTVLCGYSPLILNAGNATSYQWQDGSSTPDFAVTQSGTYSVTISNIYNCTASDQITIIVHPVPL
ncbi:MAG: hypothetical protein H0X62_16735, partial [Bacteroidetes bacterium]|nr:hypothetical protein [Bacteroidota bacterium]